MTAPVSRVARWLPIAGWLPSYRRADLTGDAMAGIIVAIMLVPQGMAYAMLAGLPPQAGLYAGMLPVFLYALFGSSRAMAVGPVAIASLMVSSTLSEHFAPGSDAYWAGALILAFMTGVMLLVMGIARLGFLVNFLGHPVISGFTSAAAIVIAFSQLGHMLGLSIPRGKRFDEIALEVVRQADRINWITVGISAGAIAVLLASRGPLKRLLTTLKAPGLLTDALTKSGPLLVVALGTGVVAALALNVGAGVKIVGVIPAGLPPLTAPHYDPALWLDLAPGAALIAIVGFLESVSVAKSLASKRRQKIEPNQELLGLGAANLGAAVTGAYPVAGGFGRSMVNFSAGANTPLASMLTAVLLGVTLLLFTPLFHHLPRAVLAAIILLAVLQLVDFHTLRLTWRYSKADAAALIVTFLAVLTIGVELGIVAGAVLALALHLYRTSRPHMAVVGRVGETEHFRNVRRHSVRTEPHILAVRVDESLYFGNARFLEDELLAHVADHLRIEHLLLICSAVNSIDASALETLEILIGRLRDAGVTLHLAEVKGPVMDRLQRVDFLDYLAPGQVFLSTHEAFCALHPAAGPTAD